MSRRRSKGSHGSRLDFEVNIVPVIDCFTILITFMLAAGVYVSIGVLDVGISEADARSTEVVTPKPEIEVKLLAGHRIAVRYGLASSQKHTEFGPLAGATSEWDLASLQKLLSELKTTWPDVTSATVIQTAGNYDDMIRAMAAVRKSHNDMLLGGL